MQKLLLKLYRNKHPQILWLPQQLSAYKGIFSIHTTPDIFVNGVFTLKTQKEWLPSILRQNTMSLNLLDSGLTRVMVAVDVGLTVGKQLYLQIDNEFGVQDL